MVSTGCKGIYTKKQACLEINANLCIKSYQGHGHLGRALMEKSLSDDIPHKEAVLYVLRGNNPAIGFYEHTWVLCLPVIFTQDTGFGEYC